MKETALNFLKWILKKLAQLTIWRYRPGIIGVTGSVGKTSTKLAIAAVLSAEREVRAARGNFNNELGMPMTILGDWEEVKGKLFWIKVILIGMFRVIFKAHYPEILILEYGVDAPGDMKRMLAIARPNLSVITAVGEIPVHVEFFGGPEEVAREKGRIIESLPSAGFAVLNHDDDTVFDLKERTRAQVLSYGFTKGSMVRISNFENRSDGDRPVGVSFKLEYGGSFVPVRIDGAFGKAQAYAAGAAATVGLIFDLNLVKISESLRSSRPAHHRMELLPGVKYTYIIDDAYNASPLSMHAALENLKSLPGKRKVAVLGDMLEIGKYAMDAHEAIGKLAAKSADVLVTVGARAKFIAEGAREAGMQKKAIYEFEDADAAAKPTQALLRKGDLILVKASHGLHLDKVVEEIKAF